uniref:hypothetical protein n=1 Tax=Nonomuraea sp. CA-251285 TaxID=3240002 RepID=UPI003F49407A
MARVVIRRGLEGVVAAQLVRPRVERILDRVADRAQRDAPPAKAWLTNEDERVRPSHRAAHEQTIPANIPYQLQKTFYVRRGRGRGGKAINPGGGWKTLDATFGYDLAMEPRDPGLPIEQRIECRCESVELPGLVGRSIAAMPVTVTGRRVTGRVEARFRRIAESEYADGGGFMRQALLAEAARLVRTRR